MSKNDKNDKKNEVDSLPDTTVHWIYSANPKIVPYLKLARLDRPIGILLLLWPCLWSLSLAFLSARLSNNNSIPVDQFLLYTLLFISGTIAMRGAGCTFNDIVDRSLDKKVLRTQNRPLASNSLSLWQAYKFLFLELIFGASVLSFFNTYTIILSIFVVPFIFIYPLMKRITYFPQVLLGIIFSWGALVGWSAVTGSVSLAPALLYLGCIAWVIGYDTIYALQDIEDDSLVGIKSTALFFKNNVKKFIYVCYFLFFVLYCLSIYIVFNNLYVLPLFALIFIFFIKKIYYLDTKNEKKCLDVFISNKNLGIACYVFIYLAYLLR